MSRLRILILSKRQYTAKDLVDDRYGRLFEIPAALSQMGHEVKGYCLSYRRRDEGEFGWEQYPALQWFSRNATPTGLLLFERDLERYLVQWRPDVVWASSDMLHAILAYRWTRKQKIPLILDLYDNYESFGMARVPGLRSLYREACVNAEMITTVSRGIQNLLQNEVGRKGTVGIVPNAARKDLFRHRDKLECRKALGLPENAQVIGTAGAITRGRGIEDLFEAFLQLAEWNDNVWLAYAGPRDSVHCQYQHPHIVDLGVMELERVPLLVSSLDVAVVCNRDTEFGRCCFPLKLLEALSSGVPVVAANVGDVTSYLAGRQDCLYEPGQSGELAQKIESHLAGFSFSSLPDAPGWETSARQLLAAIYSIQGTPR